VIIFKSIALMGSVFKDEAIDVWMASVGESLGEAERA